MNITNLLPFFKKKQYGIYPDGLKVHVAGIIGSCEIISYNSYSEKYHVLIRNFNKVNQYSKRSLVPIWDSKLQEATWNLENAEEEKRKILERKKLIEVEIEDVNLEINKWKFFIPKK